MVKKMDYSDDEWRKKLTPPQYEVTRRKGTEPPFNGKYHDCKEKGVYLCVCCGNKLFDSEAKYNSGTGWPSYYEPRSGESIDRELDADGIRTEVLCKKCGAHLGHVFGDGPLPTGLRYCINSASLDLEKAK